MSQVIVLCQYEEADGAAIEATSRYYGGRGESTSAAPPAQPRSVKYTTPHSQSGRSSGKFVPAIRAEETRKAADTLNLDEFLAESSAAEMRRMGGRK